jgi:hypothetical protein
LISATGSAAVLMFTSRGATTLSPPNLSADFVARIHRDRREAQWCYSGKVRGRAGGSRWVELTIGVWFPKARMRLLLVVYIPDWDVELQARRVRDARPAQEASLNHSESTRWEEDEEKEHTYLPFALRIAGPLHVQPSARAAHRHKMARGFRIEPSQRCTS